MGTFQHKLARVKGKPYPRNWAFFDVEANIDKSIKDTQLHTCKLGWLCYYRYGQKDKPPVELWHDFRSPNEFWNQLLSICESDRKLVILGYNVGYDFRLVNGFQCLADRGYKQERLYYKSHVVIMSFVKGKHNIIVLDAMNYFTGRLEEWGTMLGVPKGKVDFDTVSDAELSDYCKQDVLILKELMFKLWDFLKVNKLGGFAVTKASQAMQAYRQTYMTRNIYIHADPDAIQLERDSYYGGRTECFFIGSPPFKRFWKIDINSMYPYIMKTTPVPYNLRSVRLHPSTTVVKEALEKQGVIALVDLNTDIPAFPLVYNKRVCYPIGSFTTTLPGPELHLAIRLGYVKAVRLAAFYDIAIRFKGYMTDMYALRNQYKAKGNKVFEQLTKYLMNSLYGKFGQYNEHTVECPEAGIFPDGEHTYVNLETGKQCRIVCIAGQAWRTTGRTESCNSFPAIASYITSSARMYLWQLIVKAGCRNVFYTDTDSLIVNQTGWRNLRSMVNETKLGSFKLEYITKKLVIQGLKDYETDKEHHIKGITKQAEKVSQNVYKQYQWEGLRGGIAAGRTDSVRLKQVTKRLLRIYHKGTVSKSGYVIPYELSVST